MWLMLATTTPAVGTTQYTCAPPHIVSVNASLLQRIYQSSYGARRTPSSSVYAEEMRKCHLEGAKSRRKMKKNEGGYIWILTYQNRYSLKYTTIRLSEYLCQICSVNWLTVIMLPVLYQPKLYAFAASSCQNFAAIQSAFYFPILICYTTYTMNILI